MPATSAPVERVLSQGWIIMRPNRAISRTNFGGLGIDLGLGLEIAVLEHNTVLRVFGGVVWYGTLE